MPNVLAPQYYQDDFQIISELLISPVTGTALLYADRDLVIDSITYGVSVVGGAGASLQLVKTTSGTAASPASALAATVAAGTTLHSAQVITTGGTFSPALTTPASDTNLIRAGNWLGVIVAGTIGSAAVIVQMRIRSRLN